MKQAGVTVLMSTHYMDEAAALCDRLAIMHHGKILTEGAPDELVVRHAGSEVAQVRVSNGARQDVVDWIGKAGFEYREAGAVITVTSRNGCVPISPAWRECGSPIVLPTSRTSSSPWRAGS